MFFATIGMSLLKEKGLQFWNTKETEWALDAQESSCEIHAGAYTIHTFTFYGQILVNLEPSKESLLDTFMQLLLLSLMNIFVSWPSAEVRIVVVKLRRLQCSLKSHPRIPIKGILILGQDWDTCWTLQSKEIIKQNGQSRRILAHETRWAGCP